MVGHSCQLAVMMCTLQVERVRKIGIEKADMLVQGSAGVMHDPNMFSVVMYYHHVKPSVGYDFGLYIFGYNKLDFSDGGWPTVTGQIAPRFSTRPNRTKQ